MVGAKSYSALRTQHSALSDVRVLDLSRVLAGPYCTMMLGDLGADVIKVESPEGDDTRRWGPPYQGGEAAYYLCCNRNKRGAVRQRAPSEGRQLVGRGARRGGRASTYPCSTRTLPGWRTWGATTWCRATSHRATATPTPISCPTRPSPPPTAGSSWPRATTASGSASAPPSAAPI